MTGSKSKSCTYDTISYAESCIKDATITEETEKSAEENSKITSIKCADLILCAVIVIFSFSNCLNTISDANDSMTESIREASLYTDVFGSDGVLSDAFPEIETTLQSRPDSSAPGLGTGMEDAPADSAKEKDNSVKVPKHSSQKTGSAVKIPSSEEEIVKYFNASVNRVKPNAKSIAFTNDESYQAGGIDLAVLGAFESSIDKLISSFMGKNEEKNGLVATSQEDKQKYFPVENEAWSSRLTADDVKEAKCSEENGIYTISIKVYDDELSENPVNSSNHHTRAFSVVKAGDINKNAGTAKMLLSGLKTGYKDGTIVCRIDSKTGNMLSVSYDYVWILHVDSFGGVEAPFGSRQSFDIKW